MLEQSEGSSSAKVTWLWHAYLYVFWLLCLMLFDFCSDLYFYQETRLLWRVNQKVVYSAHKSKANFNRGNWWYTRMMSLVHCFSTQTTVLCAVRHYYRGESHCLWEYCKKLYNSATFQMGYHVELPQLCPFCAYAATHDLEHLRALPINSI